MCHLAGSYKFPLANLYKQLQLEFNDIETCVEFQCYPLVGTGHLLRDVGGLSKRSCELCLVM